MDRFPLERIISRRIFLEGSLAAAALAAAVRLGAPGIVGAATPAGASARRLGLPGGSGSDPAGWLTPPERRTLVAFAEMALSRDGATSPPPLDGRPAAEATADRLADELAEQIDAVRLPVRALLVVLEAGPLEEASVPFSLLGIPDRTRFCVRWAESEDPSGAPLLDPVAGMEDLGTLRRVAVYALAQLVGFFYYGMPATWVEVGYPGPWGAWETATWRREHPGVPWPFPARPFGGERLLGIPRTGSPEISYEPGVPPAAGGTLPRREPAS